MRRIATVATAILTAAVLSACALPPHRTKTSDILPTADDLPSVAKLPVRAGVYYSSGFMHETRSRTSGDLSWIVPIGAASQTMFDGVFPRVFAQITQIGHLTPDEIESQKADVVIAPTIENFEFLLGMDPESPRWGVAYRMTLYDRRGVPVASWIVAGNGPRGGYPEPETSIRNDLKDAAANFVRGIERNAGPAIAAIRAREEGSQATVDPRNVQLSARPAELPGLNAKEVETLHKGGVVTIRLSAHSEAATGLVIRASDARLRLADGRTIEPASVSSVLNDLDRLAEDHGLAAAMIGGPFLGVLVSSSENNTQQAQRDTETTGVTKVLFAERTLARDDDVSGLVLFRLPKEERAVRPAALTVWVVDPPAADGAQIEVPLSEGQNHAAAPISSF